MIESYGTNSSAVIEFREAIKDYGGNKRIGPVNFSIKEGEIVGFLGPNGSGKTTCIRLILGLIKATSGSIKVNGFDPISNHVYCFLFFICCNFNDKYHLSKPTVLDPSSDFLSLPPREVRTKTFCLAPSKN